MKDLLEELVTIYSNLNEKCNGELVDKEEINDISESLQEDFQEDYARLEKGVKVMQELDLSTFSGPDDANYLDGMVNIYTSLLDMENYFNDLRELHIKISKKIRYLSGEITLEEYLDDGGLEVEYVVEEDEV